jgi:hypothetical protein
MKHIFAGRVMMKCSKSKSTHMCSQHEFNMECVDMRNVWNLGNRKMAVVGDPALHNLKRCLLARWKHIYRRKTAFGSCNWNGEIDEI